MRPPLLAVLALALSSAPSASSADDGQVLGNATDAAGRPPSSANAVLSRRRRYVVFPRGSSLQLVFEVSQGLYVPLTTIFASTLTFGMAWRLPSQPHQVYLQRRAAGRDPDRPHRARLLADMTVLLDKLGLPGQHCVRRTLCELHRGQQTRGGFMEEMLRAVFTVPEGVAAGRGMFGLDDVESVCQSRVSDCPSVLDVPIEQHVASA